MGKRVFIEKFHFFLFTVLFAISFTSANASSIKKVFFDRNLKAVDYEEFAEYYRVEMYPDDKTEPIVYRLYSRTGTLLAEGTATHLDAKDHSKSIYVGENISYYNNGNVAERFILEKPGPLAEATYYEAYSEDNRLNMKGTQSDGGFTGEKYDYEVNGIVYHYFLENGIQQGEMQIYNGDKLYLTTSFVKGKEEGKRTTYYPSGKKSSEQVISNDLENGLYESFDENGRVVNRIPYKNGLPVGTVILNMNDMDGATSYKYYEMKSAANAPLFISVYASKKEYTVSDRRLKTRSGNKISGHHDHFNILRYDLFIQNLTDKSITTSIDDIKVITYKKNAKKKENVSSPRSFAGKELNKGYGNELDIYIDEENAKEICIRHFSHESEVAYENASDIAKSAATTTSDSFGYQTDYSKASANQTSGTASAVIGGSASQYGAVGNNGYVFGGSRGGWAALGASASKTSASASSLSYSSNIQSTRTVSGAVYYQVLEAEQNKAAKYVSRVQQQSMDEIERLITSDFCIPAHQSIEREILASEELEDFIELSFIINGYEYSLILED